MKNLTIVLTVVLVISLSAVPVMYKVGMEKSAALLDEKVAENVAQMRKEFVQLNQDQEASLLAVLKDKEIEWARKQDELRGQIRELLLNSGVTLEQLNAPPAADMKALVISQKTYNSLEKGQTLAAVVAAVGRDGENIMNMEDAAGKTSGYEWKWDNDKGEPETLTATFINGKLHHKTYSAFDF